MKAYPRLGAPHRLDHVQTMEPGEQSARVGLHMSVVLGDEVQQQPHLLLLHRLYQEAVVVRQKERAAGLAGRCQQAQCPATQINSNNSSKHKETNKQTSE